MALTREQVIEWIKSRSTRELAALLAALEQALELIPPEPEPPERGEMLVMSEVRWTECYAVKLEEVGPNRAAVMRALRKLRPISLLAAQDIVERAKLDYLARHATQKRAEEIAALFRAAGATVRVFSE